MSNSTYAHTWYDETGIKPVDSNKPEDLRQSYDFLVIGGGLAGLVLALSLRKGGAEVALLEARKVASGASGRNGGFCSDGWAANRAVISPTLGMEVSEVLQQISSEGLNWMCDRVSMLAYESSQVKFGGLNLSLSNRHSFDKNEVINKPDLDLFIRSPRYKAGIKTNKEFHFHPLNFMRSLMSECIENGVHIFEDSSVISVERLIGGGFGAHCNGSLTRVVAKELVYTTGGYGLNKNSLLSKIILPVETFIAVSEPMPNLLDDYIITNACVSDTRRAGNYYRKIRENRLLWGMGIRALGQSSIDQILISARNDLRAHFPKLEQIMTQNGIKFEYAWSGKMAYARHFLPYVGKLEDGIYTAVGFGGHGMNTAPISAIYLAKFLLGDSYALTPFNQISRLPVYGVLGKFAAEATYRYMAMRDSISEFN
jgi:gamma-glutamylputrescine oxidase